MKKFIAVMLFFAINTANAQSESVDPKLEAVELATQGLLVADCGYKDEDTARKYSISFVIASKEGVAAEALNKFNKAKNSNDSLKENDRQFYCNMLHRMFIKTFDKNVTI